jgi:outer membrane protein, heavy metal efflux system
MVRPIFYAALLLIFCTSAHGEKAGIDAAKTANEVKVVYFEPGAAITLSQALAAALEGNPALAAFSWEVRAQEAEVLQAGLRPNPEAEAMVEDFGGTGGRSGFRSAQTTLQISQLVELGRKRVKRQAAAAFRKDLANWDYETKRLDVLADVVKAFVDVLALQERETLNIDLVTLAEQTNQTVSERVKAGEVAPLEGTKAGVALATIRIELERTRLTLGAARKRLAALWGSATPLFEKVEGDFYRLPPLPAPDRFNDDVLRNPDVARWETELKHRKAVLDVEKSLSNPNLTVLAGPRYYSDEGDTTFIVGLAIPLPIFDRNQGNIQAAHFRLAKGQEESKAANIQGRTALAESIQSLTAAFKQSTSLETTIIPAAQTAFDAAKEGYLQGKFGYLDVLDAQRTLFEAKGQYIESLASYHKAQAEVERLTGERLKDIQAIFENKQTGDPR